MYFIKTPRWIKKLYPHLTWDVPTEKKEIFLTFDDGPHEVATPFVLDVLKNYQAKATFFCIGKNVVAHPTLYERIKQEGHSVGNHTYDHLNGWKNADTVYLENILKAQEVINSNLFRPPYGRIKSSQVKLVLPGFKIIMWDVLSGDFDVKLKPQKCLDYVVRKSKPGSIIVFHDSAKAYERLEFVLPNALEYFSKEGYTFSSL